MRHLLLQWKVKGLRKRRRAVWRMTLISPFLEYLGIAKPKNFPRGSVVKPKFEKSLFPFTFRVISTIFGIRHFLFSEFFG